MSEGSDDDMGAIEHPDSPAGGPGGEAPVRTWRPRGVILTGAVFTVLIAVGLVVAWNGLPVVTREAFTAFQVITLVVIVGLLVGVMWLLAGSSVRADDEGLTIRNGWRRHRVAWGQIRRVRLRPGDPWATAELTDAGDRPATDDEPRTVMLFGIQGSEGASARAAVDELNTQLASRRRGA